MLTILLYLIGGIIGLFLLGFASGVVLGTLTALMGAVGSGDKN